MNLLYTITSYPPSIGGTQLYLHLLAQQLQNRHTIQVVSQWDEYRTDWLIGTTINSPVSNKDYTIDGINVHRIGLTVKEKILLAPFIPIYYPLMNLSLNQISTILTRQLVSYARKADLIHNVRQGREGLSYASFKVARKNNIPFALTPVHHPRWVGWRYKSYINLYANSDLILALTNTEKKVLIKHGVSEEKIAVTGMGPNLAKKADPEFFTRKYKIVGPIILFLGQHYFYKGYLHLLKSTNLVWKEIPEAYFVFIGPAVGHSERYFKFFREDRIIRLGKVSLQEKTDALAACSILCVPSVQESFGAVYTEAWSFGKPVIGCNIPAVSEVISDNIDGYLVSQKPEKIAERICFLLSNPSLAKKMGMEGKRKVEEHFNWRRIGELTEEAYRKALGG